MISSESWLLQRQTKFNIPPNPLFSEQDRFSFIGSCFSDEIAGRFHQHYLITQTNPFGTLFTPNAIKNNLSILFHEKSIQLESYQNLWHFLDGAARFQSSSQDALLEQIQSTKTQFLDHLKSSNYLFITLGSAYYYRYLKTKTPVGNCHRIPQKEFEKSRFTVPEVYSDLVDIYSMSEQHLPQCRLIFTISPVRHLRDGIRENVISKSILQVALQEFLDSHPSVHYFPSFEIAQEELRDHRYFQEDLAHLNREATDYITLRLIETYGTNSFKDFWDLTNKHRASSTHSKTRKVELDMERWRFDRQTLLEQMR